MSTAGGLTLSNQGGINDENVKEKSTSKTISSSSTCALWGASMITTRSVQISVYHGVSQMEKIWVNVRNLFVHDLCHFNNLRSNDLFI